MHMDEMDHIVDHEINHIFIEYLKLYKIWYGSPGKLNYK